MSTREDPATRSTHPPGAQFARNGQVAARLRLQLADSTTSGFEPGLTPSLGVAQWTSGTVSEELLAAADSALPAAKHSPRLIDAREPSANAP
jgi:hypothetical protein